MVRYRSPPSVAARVLGLALAFAAAFAAGVIFAVTTDAAAYINRHF